MASASEIARRYFSALTAHDLDAAVACWRPGAIDRLVGTAELVAPDGIRAYFGGLFDAFPDFGFEVLEVTSARGRTAIRGAPRRPSRARAASRASRPTTLGWRSRAVTSSPSRTT
ncbi:MAG: nuclear transport factor 2 family protein [Solirubrobacteraceae bacterium]